MQKRIQETRSSLASLQVLADKTRAAEQNILDAATERREAVQRDLDTMRPQTLTSEDAADHYQALIHERGKLDIVIGSAQRHLK